MAELGTGITVSFQSGLFAEILDYGQSNQSRPAIDVSHMESASREYMPGDLVDWGQMDLEIAFDPAADYITALKAPVESVTVTYRDGSTYVGNAFMTEMEITGTLEERMTANAVLMWEMEYTHTPATP